MNSDLFLPLLLVFLLGGEGGCNDSTAALSCCLIILCLCTGCNRPFDQNTI